MKNIQLPSCNHCKNENKLFCGLGHSDRESLSEGKKGNKFTSGEIIFREASQPYNLFCIYNGKVKLSKVGSEGKEQIVGFAKQGEVIGFSSLISNQPYNVTATAIEDSYICAISKQAFIERLNNNNVLSQNLIQLLSDSLKNSEDKLISISQSPVKERVAHAILMLITSFGFEKDGSTLSVVLTRREIGEIACTTTETTIRTLAQLRQDRIIELRQKKIKVIDMDRLVSLAESNSPLF